MPLCLGFFSFVCCSYHSLEHFWLFFFFFPENVAVDKKMAVLGFTFELYFRWKNSVKIYTVLQEKIFKNYCKSIFENIPKTWQHYYQRFDRNISQRKFFLIMIKLIMIDLIRVLGLPGVMWALGVLTALEVLWGIGKNGYWERLPLLQHALMPLSKCTKAK